MTQQAEIHKRLLETREIEKKIQLENAESERKRELESQIALQEIEFKKQESQRRFELQAAESARKLQIKERAADLAARESEAKIRSLEIESERNYELLRIQNENKLRAENEKSIREADTQIRLAEISASSSNVTVSKSQNSFNDMGCKQIRDLPPLRSTDRDDIENFFLHFERLCAINNNPGDRFCSYLTAKLPIEMVHSLTRVTLEMANDYKLFRSNVAKKYLLTSDFYKKKFYSLSLQQGDSNAEFINQLQDALQRWLNAEKVETTYESIFQFILKTQYYHKIDVKKLIFIKEHRVQTLIVGS